MWFWLGSSPKCCDLSPRLTKLVLLGFIYARLIDLFMLIWGQASPNAASLGSDVSAAQGQGLLCTGVL